MDRFDLTVSVPADEWADAQRRLAWLEGMLLRIVRERSALREWYGAGELEALQLPGLPPSRQAIARLANKEGSPRIRRGQRVSPDCLAAPLMPCLPA